MGFNRLFDARGFCGGDPPNPNAWQITITDYADQDDAPQFDAVEGYRPQLDCTLAVNGRGDTAHVEFDVEHLDQFIASLQEARAVLVGEAGGQLTQEQAEAAAGMEPLEEIRHQNPRPEDGGVVVVPDGTLTGPLAGVQVHPWPDFGRDEEVG